MVSVLYSTMARSCETVRVVFTIVTTFYSHSVLLPLVLEESSKFLLDTKMLSDIEAQKNCITEANTDLYHSWRRFEIETSL